MKNGVTIRQQIQGCLLGGATGDALGYPIEFERQSQVQANYGRGGMTFDKFTGQPIISDDTQMTLFTASGLLLPGNPLKNVWDSYQDWLDTQFKPDVSMLSHVPVSWLVNDPVMFASRNPGRTCLMSLSHGQPGSIDCPINQSKGCGSVMRIAPVGLLVDYVADDDVIEMAADIATLTHGHIMSTMASAFMAVLIRKIVKTNGTLKMQVQTTLTLIQTAFQQETALTAFSQLIQRAIDYSQSDEDEGKRIYTLGAGWVAEETLAIALYCALKYPQFEKTSHAIEVAVNHDGDSDSTGALTGQILGAKHGADALPLNFVRRLDAYTPIQKVAKLCEENAG